MHLVEQFEAHAIGGGAELLDLIEGPRLLGAEVVAGEAEDGEALGGEAVLQRLQAGVLAREAAAAGHVDDQQHRAAPLAEPALLAGGGAHHHVTHVQRHGVLGMDVRRGP